MLLGNTCANFGKNVFHSLGVSLSRKETVKAMYSVFLLKIINFLFFFPYEIPIFSLSTSVNIFCVIC